MPWSIPGSLLTEPKPPEDPTWLDIVVGQFFRRSLSVSAALGVLVLWGLAILAPVMASNKPFVWRVGDGPLQFPWFKSLFDQIFFENGVDLFFNTLLVALVVVGPAVFLLWRRSASLPRRPRTLRRGWIAGAAVGIWLVFLGGVMAFPYQAPKEVYPLLEKSVRATGQEVLAIYPPIPHSFRDGDIGRALQPSSSDHWLGTDSSGRDVLTRLLFGTRVSLTVGVFAVALYVTLGVIIGALAGYFGGWVDLVIQRVIEVVICVPSLFLVLSVASFLTERSIFHILFIIAAVSWTGPARLVRAEFLRLRELDFVAAARAAGFSQPVIIFQEILPNALGPVLVSATFGVASAILVESTMSFLGLGDATLPSWGQILNNGRSSGVWTMILAPGSAIFVTVSLLNLVGEGVRDALDPKLRK